MSDEETEEEYDDEEICGYECMSCGHIQSDQGFHCCERCCGPITEIYY